MILPDVNTLLYAVNRSSDQHATALKALQQGFDDPVMCGPVTQT